MRARVKGRLPKPVNVCQALVHCAAQLSRVRPLPIMEDARSGSSMQRYTQSKAAPLILSNSLRTGPDKILGAFPLEHTYQRKNDT